MGTPPRPEARAVLTAGRSGGPSSPAAVSAPSSGPAAPGAVHVEVADVDLTITDAVAHSDRSGDGSLSMLVRNRSGVPEHLAMVAAPEGGHILLLSGTTVAFHGGGPNVLLHHVRGVTARHPLPLALQFGVAGLVHLRADVGRSRG